MSSVSANILNFVLFFVVRGVREDRRGKIWILSECDVWLWPVGHV